MPDKSDFVCWSEECCEVGLLLSLRSTLAPLLSPPVPSFPVCSEILLSTVMLNSSDDFQALNVSVLTVF